MQDNKDHSQGRAEPLGKVRRKVMLERIDPPEGKSHPCPVCGAELTDEVFINWAGDVIGCSECVTRRDAEDYLLDERYK